MRPVVRLLLAVALASLPIGLALVNCGTDAQNIDACRQIEDARCEAAPACSAGLDVDGCKRFYRDACLNGLQNPDAGDVTSLVQPCIQAVQACAKASASTDPGCPGQTLHAGAECNDSAGHTLTPTPCNIVTHCPEVLEACHWVWAQPPVGTGGSDGGTGGSGGTGGKGTGGSGGSG